MKKIVLFTLLAISVFTSKAEIWLDLGVKGGFATGIFTNPHVISGTNQQLQLKGGYLGGIKGAVNFNLKHSIAIDFIYVSTTQSLMNGLTKTSTDLQFSTFDLPIMYRVNQDNGGYAEIGPQFSFTQSAKQSFLGAAKNDISGQFKKSNLGVAAGFGQYIGGGDAFGFNFGFRFAYTLADIVTPGSANAVDDPIYQPYSADEIASYSYKKSGRLYVGIILEFNFNLGYFAKGAACTKKTKFRLF